MAVSRFSTASFANYSDYGIETFRGSTLFLIWCPWFWCHTLCAIFGRCSGHVVNNYTESGHSHECVRAALSSLHLAAALVQARLPAKALTVVYEVLIVPELAPCSIMQFHQGREWTTCLKVMYRQPPLAHG